MASLAVATLHAAQPVAVAPTAIPLPRSAAAALRDAARGTPCAQASLAPLSEGRTPQTRSPGSSLGSAESLPSARSSDPSPHRAALEGPEAATKGTDSHRAAIEKCHAAAPTPTPGLEGDVALEYPSLVQVFAELRAQQADPCCILTLRKAQLLGDRPTGALESYFGRIPGFKRVFVVYSHVKLSRRGAAAFRRVRLEPKPSGLAFVLFASPGCARLALANGSEQSVDGITVSVGRYKPQDAAQPLLQAKPRYITI